MGISIGLGVAAGWWVDKRFGCAPWGVVSGGVLGTAVGTYYMLKELS
jgi:F0F1-type ATP synthase assembly protein I